VFLIHPDGASILDKLVTAHALENEQTQWWAGDPGSFFSLTSRRGHEHPVDGHADRPGKIYNRHWDAKNGQARAASGWPSN
jgi:hypothetical protein